MIHTTPTHGFAAINPPLWLQQDMDWHGPRFKGVNALIFFADDLPGIETLQGGRFPQQVAEQRLQCFGKMVGSVWGQSPKALNLRTSTAFNMYGQIAGNATQNKTENLVNRITGQTEDHIISRTAPTHATIVLPPRAWDVRAFTAAVANIPYFMCADLPNVNPHRAVAGHELGHLRQYCDIGLKLDPRFTELTADTAATNNCHRTNDAASANYLREWRLLNNLQGDLSPKSVAYWNSLFQNGIDGDMLDECAAQLEVKLMASFSEIKPPKNASWFVRAALDAGHYPSLHTCFNHGMGPAPISLLRNLEQRHKPSNYRYDASYQLAERTLEAAHRLTPGVFAPIKQLVAA